MTHTDRDVIKGLMMLAHPVPSHQDGTCLHIEWQGMVHNSGIGDGNANYELKHTEIYYMAEEMKTQNIFRATVQIMKPAHST